MLRFLSHCAIACLRIARLVTGTRRLATRWVTGEMVDDAAETENSSDHTSIIALSPRGRQVKQSLD